ncbi:CBO0543 family protein [Rossellomorea sp. NS-SX7]|uniref:CBO0543 family protein n=1 Tax=Rossellomorea sp. NS-SX7 TaxID=3463856 RepID=UPI004058BBB7
MIEQYDKVHSELLKASKLNIDYWLEYNFLTLKWWVIVAAMILLWLVFLKLVKRDDLPKILFFGLVWIIVAANLDGFGFELGLWGYPTELLPIYPKAYLFDYAMIPVSYMLLYYYFPRGKAFFIANIVLAGGASFISEPFFRWLDYYKAYYWNPWWSFLIYFIVSYMIRWFVERIFSQKNVLPET